MTSIRQFTLSDLLKFNNVNLDVLTETYNGSFYMAYLSQWPESFLVAKAPGGQIMGYLLGKAEGIGALWHGHVSAITVAPEYRRLGLAKTLMNLYENDVCVNQYNTYFVDLFVRASNTLAIRMYQSFGYVIYRTVTQYYSGESSEDAYDMRKALPRDVYKNSIKPLNNPIISPDELEW